jgi:hypothetical protein
MLADRMSSAEGYMRLAMRAQSQCRATLKTLSDIKSPPTVYARQANIAQGHQQVNNMSPCPLANEYTQNQLLEENDGKWMDRRATQASGRADQVMETVGEFDRPED